MLTFTSPAQLKPLVLLLPRRILIPPSLAFIGLGLVKKRKKQLSIFCSRQPEVGEKE